MTDKNISPSIKFQPLSPEQTLEKAGTSNLLTSIKVSLQMSLLESIRRGNQIIS